MSESEVELIRRQLAHERRHATLVAQACVTALEASRVQVLDSLDLTAFCQTCIEYLVWVLKRFEQRDRMQLSLGYSRHGGEDRRRELAEVLGRAGRSREALTRLETALDHAGEKGMSAQAHPATWREFAQFFCGDWSARHEALDEIFGRIATVAEWRSVAGIDGGSILDERNRFARVQAAAPHGIELRALPARA
jgi:hypothetical protein